MSGIQNLYKGKHYYCYLYYFFSQKNNILVYRNLWEYFVHELETSLTLPHPFGRKQMGLTDCVVVEQGLPMSMCPSPKSVPASVRRRILQCLNALCGRWFVLFCFSPAQGIRSGLYILSYIPSPPF